MAQQPNKSQARLAEKNVTDGGPQLTMMWNLQRSRLQIPLIKAIGADVVWLLGKDEELPDNAAALQAKGLVCMSNYKVLNKADWAETVPELRPRFFIASVPRKANARRLKIPLLNKYGEGFQIEEDEFYLPYWRVWDRTEGTVVDPKAWEYSDGRVTISNAVVGHEYNVAFSVIDKNEGITLDLFSADAQQLIIDDYRRVMDADPSLMLRPTQFAFYFYHREFPDGIFLDWYGAGWTTSRHFIERYERKYDKPFDIGTMFSNGDLRSSNDQRHDGYQEILKLQREVCADFAMRFTHGFKKYHRDVRMFWGDAWVGLEPTHPDFPALGFDQIVGAISVPQDVRRLMSVSPQVRRNLRFGFWGTKTGKGIQTFEKDWNCFLRGALRTFPEGMTVGGPSVVPLLKNEAGFQEYVTDRFDDFKNLYGWIHREQSYSNGLRVGVVNSQGSLRPWPREFTVNDSQKVWRGLTDLPVEVQWLSFADLASGGVPDGIDVLLNVGEPGSAWAGGSEWSTPVVAAVEAFVSAGGGFIGIDGCGVTSASLRLEDLLGIRYEGLASSSAELGVFNNKDRFRKFISARPEKHTQLLRISAETSRQFGCQMSVGEIAVNTKMSIPPSSDALRLDKCESSFAALTRRKVGLGQAWYLSGLPATENGFDFMKRLLYEAAGQTELREQLDCETIGGSVYWYPKKRILIAFNHDVASGELELNLGALGTAAKLHGDPLTKKTDAMICSDGHASVKLARGSFAAWTIVDPNRENVIK